VWAKKISWSRSRAFRSCLRIRKPRVGKLGGPNAPVATALSRRHCFGAVGCPFTFLGRPGRFGLSTPVRKGAFSYWRLRRTEGGLALQKAANVCLMACEAFRTFGWYRIRTIGTSSDGLRDQSPPEKDSKVQGDQQTSSIGTYLP
jgi:hypothetical protein